MSLTEYKRKRNFAVTPEPAPKLAKKSPKSSRRFVIQKHDATRLHYDFRLEMNGALTSWAIPKGLPMAKGERHLAIKVEDHPLSYIHFEGTIPKGQYGGGTVQVWDFGTYVPLTSAPQKDLSRGKLHVILKGEKLSGEWYLVKLKDEEDQWLIIRGGDDHRKFSKEKDERSALSGKTMHQLAHSDAVWNSNAKDSAKEITKTTSASPSTKTKIASGTNANKHTGDKAESLGIDFIPPMLARIQEDVPRGDWSYEIKFDGFRALAFKKGKKVHLLSRNNHDLADKFPEIVDVLRKEVKEKDVVIDGEIVALDPKGRSSFQLLQAYELGQESPPLCYYAFDLLVKNGKSTRDLPVEERRELLESVLPEEHPVLRFSGALGNDADMLLKKARSLGLEGLIGKRAASLYESGRRSGAWVKLKLATEQEFVIGGYTEPSGTRKHFGALLVGVQKHGKLVYAGKVGTGFNDAILRDLHQRFQRFSRSDCPFTDLPERRTGRYGQGITASVMKRCHWLRPELVCQIRFAEWTRDHRLRQPVYLGLREDKPAREIVRETQSHLP